MSILDRRQLRLPYFNRNAAIAALLGIFSLAIAYWRYYHDRESFGFAIFHEIGFALIVAVIIWFTFEFFSRSETEDHWNDRIERIARNVFFGVFRRNFPQEFIREANLLLLDHTFIRRGLHLTYTISDATCAVRGGGEERFVKVNAIARFKIENVGNDAAEFHVRIGLPNPLIDEMKEFCRVLRVVVKVEGQEENLDLTDAEAKFRQDIKNDQLTAVIFDVKKITVQPEQKIEIVFDYTMAKEQEDSEVFQTAFPTDGITLTITDKGPTKRAVRAKTIHMAEFDDDTSAERNGTYNFSLSRYLLPKQGFVIWWKEVPTEPN
ncbi:hypothetical protein SE92_30360 [Bradyrhizobium sp. AT1]|uniref:hypothetical protein n=1 Tax=Bradyrhizobium sp. AT1 TaxID=574934 RepID=UPI00079C824E|nr:hypothetical protein [Bradyrhizobium sp. AT1]KYG24023.1 hypothetical protein SE92_30360 [Bradyrhizobium sp. AT1]